MGVWPKEEAVPPRFAVFAVVVLLALMMPAAVGAKSQTVRFATFNASLNRNAAGQALADLSAPGNAQANAVAEIIQRIRPDVLLINEFDFYPNNQLATAFQDNYLDLPHNGAAPIDYPFVFVAPSNTGISSGFDLNNNGITDTTPGDGRYGDDALDSACSRASSGWQSSRAIQSISTQSAPSRCSCGRTCLARCCPTIRQRRHPPTGTQRPSWTSFGCRRRATGTCRSRSKGRQSISW